MVIAWLRPTIGSTTDWDQSVVGFRERTATRPLNSETTVDRAVRSRLQQRLHCVAGGLQGLDGLVARADYVGVLLVLDE